MVGMTQDPLFGPLIGFGLGGIHVEILKDVCFRVTPITDRDAAEMVRGIKGYRLLEGYRGHPPADIAAIEDLLLRVAQTGRRSARDCRVGLESGYRAATGPRLSDRRRENSRCRKIIYRAVLFCEIPHNFAAS